MGYLVLRTDDEKRFDVIDGQQRLTTLSILVLAGLRRLRDTIEAEESVEETKKRLDGLRGAHIGYMDPVTLVSEAKLKLNRNNDHYFQTYLIPLVKPLPPR